MTPATFLADSASSTRAALATLAFADRRLSDVATDLGASRSDVWRWRRDVADMPAKKFARLRALASEVSAKRKVGT